MSNIDPDIQHVLKVLALKIKAKDEAERLKGVNNRRWRAFEDRLETKLELMSDELEQVIPKDNPAFMPMLLLALLHKLIKKQSEEPEYNSCLELPPGM